MFDELKNNYLNQTQVFLAGVHLKKKKMNSFSRALNSLSYFKRAQNFRNGMTLCLQSLK